ncbi:MAG: GIY-YIG nuclease family protein [Acidobacteriaceae bacterium]
MPTDGCIVREGATLLYVGIAPSKKPESKENVRTRLRYHFRGKAEGSTLRQSLGCWRAPLKLSQF